MLQISTTKTLVLTAILAVFSSGCAARSDMKQVQTDVQHAQKTADRALTTAQEAKTLANDANERALRNEEMLNRGFKHSMRK